SLWRKIAAKATSSVSPVPPLSVEEKKLHVTHQTDVLKAAIKDPLREIEVKALLGEAKMVTAITHSVDSRGSAALEKNFKDMFDPANDAKQVSAAMTAMGVHNLGPTAPNPIQQYERNQIATLIKLAAEYKPSRLAE